jgi:hypothetical protein
MEGGLEWSSAHLSEDDTDDKMLLCMAWMCVYGRRQAVTVDALACPSTTRYFGRSQTSLGCEQDGVLLCAHGRAQTD